MSKKLIPIFTIVLAIGLFVFVGIAQNQDKKKAEQYEEMYEQRRPLTVKQEQLEQQLIDLETEFNKASAPYSIVEVLFTELDERVYSQCYPIMKEFGYVGTLAVSLEELPGEEGCMSLEQFQELVDEGWGVCVTWPGDTVVDSWWTNLNKRLNELGIVPGKTMYFPQGTYSAELDSTIQELGFTITTSSVASEVSPLQLQYEEGVWHTGAVGLMSPKPRLWLREAVAQYANVAFLVGFEVEEELYNEKSFRSMLNCFDEYEATEELIVANTDTAREQYYKRSLGVDVKLEEEYQAQKASLEEELAQVKKQLKEIEAMY